MTDPPQNSPRRTVEAEALRRAMVVRGWSRADLAREAGVGINTITRALDPDCPLSLHTEARISAAIGRNRINEAVRAGLDEIA